VLLPLELNTRLPYGEIQPPLSRVEVNQAPPQVLPDHSLNELGLIDFHVQDSRKGPAEKRVREVHLPGQATSMVLSTSPEPEGGAFSISSSHRIPIEQPPPPERKPAPRFDQLQIFW